MRAQTVESFTQKLIDRTKLYYLTQLDLELSDEQAEEYLRTLSGAFLAFTDKNRRTPARRPSARGVRADFDLINSTLNENNDDESN